MSDLPEISHVATEAGKAIIKELYADIGHPAAAKIGAAIGAAMDIALLPIHILAHAPKLAMIWLKKNLKQFSERLDKVNEKNITQPPNEIAVPIIQKLLYVADDDIRKLYIELLAKASDSSQETAAHPSYIRVISSLSPDEARIIEYFRNHTSFPYIWARMAFLQKPSHKKFPKTAPGLDLTRDLTGIENEIRLRFPDNIPLYLTNCIALGLITRENGELSDKKKYYEPLEANYAIIQQDLYNRGHEGKQYPVFFLHGYYKVTPFGDAFIRAVT